MKWLTLDHRYLDGSGWRSIKLRTLTLIRCHKESDMKWFLRLIPCENPVFVPMDVRYPNALAALGCYPSASQAIKDGRKAWPANWDYITIGKSNLRLSLTFSVWTTSRPWTFWDKLDQLKLHICEGWHLTTQGKKGKH